MSWKGSKRRKTRRDEGGREEDYISLQGAASSPQSRSRKWATSYDWLKLDGAISSAIEDAIDGSRESSPNFCEGDLSNRISDKRSTIQPGKQAADYHQPGQDPASSP